MKKAYFNMHLAIFLWGFTGILGKAIQMPEGMIVWYRMIISAAGMLPALLRNRSSIPTPRQLVRISGVGFLVAIHWVLFYGSIKASNVSIALSCFSSISLFTALLEPLSRRERPRAAELALAITVIAGLYLVVSVDRFYFTGVLLAVGSACMGACFTILNKQLTEEHPPEVITFYELFTGFVVLSMMLPFYFRMTGTSFEIPSSMDMVYLVLLGLVCTSFAFTISLKALKKLDAFTMNLSVNLEPLYSILLAVVLFHEHDVLNVRFATGTLIILGSVATHSWYRWRRSRALPG